MNQTYHSPYSRRNQFGCRWSVWPTTFVAVAAAMQLGGCGPTGDGKTSTNLPPGFMDMDQPGFCAATTRSLAFDERLADVLILFDRSGSMRTAFGTDTRFTSEAAILKELLGAYENRIRFGVQYFPRKGGCGEGGAASCCADGPAVSVGLGQALAITDTIDRSFPADGNTPTAIALHHAANYFRDLNDGVADRYVLLSTDGHPSCTADGALARDTVTDGQWVAGPCADALRAVDELRELGVRVIVMGVGSNLDIGEGTSRSCLEQIAQAGGAVPDDPGAPPDKLALFQADNPLALERTLQRIFGAVTQPSCVLRLQNAPRSLDVVSLFFDGREVPRDATHMRGWDFIPDQPVPTIQIYGEDCARLGRFQVTEIQVRHGCPPCTDRQLCE